MAINFLDNVQFNQNQLLGARLENVTSDPTSASGGDIIFNSTTGKFKYYDGTNPFSASGWIDPALGGISGSGTIGTIPIFVTNTTTIGNSGMNVSGTGSATTLSIAYPTTVVKILRVQEDLEDVNNQTGTAGQLLSSLGGGGSGVDWIDAPVSYTKWVLTGDTGTQDILDGNTVLVAGGTNITTAVTATDTLTINASTYNLVVGASIGGPDSQLTLNCTPGTNSSVGFSGTANQIAVAAPGVGSTVTTFSLPTNVTIPGDLTVGGGDINLTGTGRIQGVDTVTASTDAANKAYVDAAVVGGFTVKGAFNANTGVIGGSPSPGNLTSGAGRVALAKGDFYVVAVAGNFFGNTATPLTPGDSVLVQTAALAGTSTESNFAIIQSDTDLATLTNVGIGNVNASAVDELLGIDVVYSTGTAKVGLDIDGLGAITTTNDASYLAIFDEDSSANKKIDVSDLGSAISSATSFAGSSLTGTTHTFNHNLGSFDVMVQTFNNNLSSADTVYASVERTSVNQVVVTTAASANIRCLIQKVG